MQIQHNIMAMNAYRNYSSNNSALSKNLEKLSSGYKINRAGDDAAGLAISEKMRAQITGLQTAQDNAKSGINLVQTAEGSLTEVHDMLNRMVELSDQSANGTYDNDTDRANLQKEVSQLKSEINRIADSSNFNGIKLLDGSLGSGTTGVSVNVAADATAKTAAFNYTVSGADEGITVQFAAANGAAVGAGVSAGWSGKTLTLTLQSDATGSNTITQDDIDAALRAASDAPDAADGMKVKIDSSISFTGASVAGAITGATGTTAKAEKATSATVSTTNVEGNATNFVVTSGTAGVDTRTLTISGAGTVGASVNAATGNITLNLDSSKDYSASEINQMLSDVGANMSVSYDGTLNSASSGIAATHTLGAGTVGAGLATGGGLTLQIGDTSDSFNKLMVSIQDMHADSLGIGSIDISTQDGASAATDLIKAAINTVSSVRGTLGATQNRLDHTINNLSVMTENVQDAESSIRDTDVAEEMMAYTKNNILVQSAQAMLAQANQVPQGVLQLLQ